jgi:hypothetical protein
MDDYTAVMIASLVVLISLLIAFLLTLKKAMDLQKKF